MADKPCFDENKYADAKGVQITLEAVDKKADKQKIRWFLNEEVTNGALFIANMKTGSARSPIDANEFVDIQNCNLKTPPVFAGDRNREYHLTLSLHNEPQFFADPELCYVAIRFIGNPFIDLNRISQLMERTDFLPKNVRLSPDGTIFVVPDSNNPHSITFPQLETIISKIEPEFPWIRQVVPAGSSIANYRFMFSIKPTLYGVYTWFKGVYDNTRRLFRGNAPHFGPMIKHRSVHREITFDKTEDFLTKLDAFVDKDAKKAFLNFILEEQEDFPNIAEILGDGLFNQDLSYLKDWVVNIPLCFRVDPTYDPSTKGSG